MQFVASDGPPASARWASALALFSAALTIAALFLHRIFSMSTPVATNAVGLAMVAGAVAVVLALLASVRIWRRGGHGTASVLVALVVAGGVIGWPLGLLATARGLPELNDITTDASDPPAFVALAAERKRPANPADYPGERFAALQAKAYPDLVAIKLNRPRAEAFDIAVEAVRRQKMAIVREEPPAPDQSRPGAIEAVDRTLILGFYDDVAIRVDGDARASRIDIRSASRYGRHDLGRNAERVRRLLREIVARLEAAPAGTVIGRGKKMLKPLPPKPGLKEEKGASAKKPPRRPQPGRAQ
jgi:hypothetical protein